MNGLNQDAVLRARVMLLSSNQRVLRGPKALPVYRLLTAVEPEVYGSKPAHVLTGAAAAPALLPQERRALLEEAVAVAQALQPGNPYRAKVLARALAALAARAAPAAPAGPGTEPAA
ncbi:hypothetical protein OH807_03575 [Kitasatospora sp. NBC_01560]|uniref:hypothetical protein n=1 Tax=Kitasatospora sp. NBC_01560 TaxID=2975965 RepID=UPI003867C4D7